jgi:hypothetical protein
VDISPSLISLTGRRSPQWLFLPTIYNILEN